MKERLKIVLFSPGNLSNQDSEGGRGVVYSPNMGLAYLTKYVEKLFGDRVEVTVMETVPQRLFDDDVRQRLSEIGPDLVGISAKTFNILSAYRLAGLAKEVDRGALVVLGGAHGTALPEFTLKECPAIDVIVRGEGELPFAGIVETLLRGGHEFGHIAGLTWRGTDGGFHSTGAGKLLQAIDDAPFPTYERYNLDDYGGEVNPITGRAERYFSIFGSRGCPFLCTFCMPLLTRKVRKRRPDKIVEEIKYLIEEMNAAFIYFEDSCMTTDLKWFEAVCGEMIRSGVNSRIRWGFETRVDVVDKAAFDCAVRAGAVYVNFGLESGSDLVLKKNRKNFTTRDILRAISVVRESGMRLIHGGFILGLPYETHRTVRENLNFMASLDLDMIPVNIVDIYPGAELFEMVERGRVG